MDLDGLARKMDTLARDIEKDASNIAIKAAIAIVGDLVRVTPVDTSAALSNWVVSLDSPDVSSYDPYYEGSRGSTRSASSAAAMEDARATLYKKKPGQVIYITNNLDYIEELNNGSSKQAPAGFVERAVLVGRNVAKGRK